MGSRRVKKAFKGVLVNDLRAITCVLVGTCIYLTLVSVFGLPRSSSIKPEPIHDFPRKLWQSWKHPAVNFEERDAQRVRSWMRENPTLRHEVLTDDNALSYVQRTFGPKGFDRPDVVQAYQNLKADIIKADLLRYIVMYAEGGIYADVDVQALMPFQEFIPKHLEEKNLDMIIGVETDEPAFKDHPILGVKSQSFCQWTFVSKPRVSVMLKLIDNIVVWLDHLKKVQQKDLPDLVFDFDTVLNGTGPSAFTTAILEEMSKTSGRLVDWNDFHKLREPKVVNGILVLPAQAFAASTGHSESGTHSSTGALVQHHFGASSWTKKHQRFKHPVYGEVERCNWNPECVKLWDTNTAKFDALSEAEQLRILEAQQMNKEKSEVPKSDDKPQLAEESKIQDEQKPESEHPPDIDRESKTDIDSRVEPDEFDPDNTTTTPEAELDHKADQDIPDVETLEELLRQDT